MNRSIVVFSAISALVIAFSLAGFPLIKPVLAQVADAVSSSTLPTLTDATSSYETIIVPDEIVTSNATTSGEVLGEIAVTDATSTEETAVIIPEDTSTETTTTSTDEVLVVEDVATSSPALIEVQLECRSAFFGNLFDTPSGRLEEGYYLDAVPATTTGTVARIIGQQAWTTCADSEGNEHEFELTDEEYADLAKPGAGMPQKSIMVPVD